jgi:hypothetical protein
LPILYYNLFLGEFQVKNTVAQRMALPAAKNSALSLRWHEFFAEYKRESGNSALSFHWHEFFAEALFSMGGCPLPGKGLRSGEAPARALAGAGGEGDTTKLRLEGAPLLRLSFRCLPSLGKER